MLFARLVKVDTIEGIAYATAAAEVPDKAGEIFDYASSKPHFEAWSDGIAKATDGKSFGNVREMHGPNAVGKLTSISFDDPGKTINVAIKIVEKSTLEKLAEGVLTGVSIGGSYEKRWPDTTDNKLTRYTAVPSEISVVDNPCMPTASFTCVKADGVEELRKFHAPAVVETPAASPVEATPDLAQVWQAKDGKTFGKKADAEAHNATLVKVTPVPETPATKLAAELAGLVGDVAKMGDAPAAATKRAMQLAKAAKSDLKKGLYSVCQLADLVQQLHWLQESAEYEAASEGDGSTMPATLQASVAALSAALIAMVQEETAELLADPNAPPVLELFEMSAGVGSLIKVFGDKVPEALTKAAARHGDEDAKNLATAHDSLSKMGFGKCAGMGKAASRFSKPDADHLQKAHDHVTKAGAPCSGKDAKDDPAPADDAKDDDKAEKLAKALEGAASKNAELEKQMSETTVQIAELRAQFAKFAKAPMLRPHERPVHAVSKGAEPVDGDDISAKVAHLPPELRNAALVEYAMNLPKQITR